MLLETLMLQFSCCRGFVLTFGYFLWGFHPLPRLLSTLWNSTVQLKGEEEKKAKITNWSYNARAAVPRDQNCKQKDYIWIGEDAAFSWSACVSLILQLNDWLTNLPRSQQNLIQRHGSKLEVVFLPSCSNSEFCDDQGNMWSRDVLSGAALTAPSSSSNSGSTWAVASSKSHMRSYQDSVLPSLPGGRS